MKMADFNISASASMKASYRELLVRDLSEDAFEETLTLVRRVLETSRYRIVFDWENLPSTRKLPYEIPAAAQDYLKEFLERANASLPEDMPEEVPDRTALERRTNEAAVFLTFQSRVNLQGDTGFVRDIQSLLFQQCVHALSPKLLSRHLEGAHSFLLHALYAHAQLAWTDVPAHQHYLLSCLYEHAGYREVGLQFLKASLDNSSPEDHDFVTKAQDYWSRLVELGNTTEAKSFALDLYRRAAPKDLPEIEELVDETYALDKRVKKAS
jgi:hypothetical protein